MSGGVTEVIEDFAVTVLGAQGVRAMTVLTHPLADYAPRSVESWRANAACRGMDTDLFYPEGRGRALRIREQIAKQVCADCPVARECRQFAAEYPERYGIWGGRTENERGWSRR